MIVKLTKEEAKKLIDDNQMTVYFENYWRYPATGDDQKTCPMLDAMFSIERRGGYIIHIPEIKPVIKSNPMSSADIHPPTPEQKPVIKKHEISESYKKEVKEES